MQHAHDGMVPFLKKEEIADLVKSIAQDIKARHGNEHLHFVCPLKGSILFLTDLSREFKDSPITIDFVKVESKGRGFSVKKDIESDISAKNVIIIEEIIDGGRTLSFLKKHLSLSLPNSIEIACLLDKPARRDIPIAPDYVGKTIDDRFVIGYGMDSDEVGRNYSDIYNFLQ